MEQEGRTRPTFRRISSCLNYRAYCAALDTGMTTTTHGRMRDQFMGLGDPEPERMGVTYIWGDWGFLIVPGPGFPELRVNVYPQHPAERDKAVLERIGRILEATGASA